MLHLLHLVRRHNLTIEGLPPEVGQAVDVLRRAVAKLDDDAFGLAVRDLIWQQSRDRLAAAGVEVPPASRPSVLATLAPKARVDALRARGQAMDDVRRAARSEAAQSRAPKVPEPREPRQTRQIGGAR
jgi:hypothetical protein